MGKEVPQEILDILKKNNSIPDDILRKYELSHVCIRIFEDDSIIITNADFTPIDGVPQDHLPGPINVYAQALWYNHSPT